MIRTLAIGAGILALVANTGLAAEKLHRTSASRFLLKHPGNWRVVEDPTSGNVSFVYGTRIPGAGANASDAQFIAAARRAVDENTELFGFTSSQLVREDVVHLNFARFGSSDKVAVTFHQAVDGIDVFNGSVSVLFDAKSGDISALDTTGIPGAAGVSLLPQSNTSSAIAAAEAAYTAAYGVAPAYVGDVTPCIVGPSPFFGLKNPLVERGAALAYVIELKNPGLADADGVPYQARVYVSAEGDLTVFKVERTAHAVITGNVSGNTNTGQEPNTVSNQETPALKNLRVRQNNAAGAILATTDASGNYSIPQNGPITLYFELAGTFARVVNNSGASASFTQAGATSGTPVNITFNPTKAEATSAEVACYHWLTYFRDSIKANDPSDTTMDFQTLANANLASTCNAFYDGSSVNFYSSGGGCVNTAYSDVVLHETGHWANEQYNGAVTGAFHEGNADGFAYHFNDDSCLTDLDGVGCLRSGTQVAVKKCPTDGDESCHGGEVHNEGQVMGSANWAVRSRLETTLGAGPGGLLATALFLGWMQTYNDGAILNVIEDHWLALDDDNADMSDLTPHFGDINAGFKDYNWPGFPDLTISSIGGPADNSAVGHLAAVGVTANIVAIVGSVSTATLKYSTGGAFSNVTMTPTGNPNQYQGVIPGLASPNTVKWYIDATSSTGGHAVGPAGAPENVRIYHVGQVTVLNSWTFDGGTDESWTHANLSGTNGDQWQRGNPAGSAASTDPHAAFSPNNVWGTDLSLAATDGMYEPSSSGELRSPTLNYSAQTSVRLQFRRWLAVEEATFDQARVLVNNTIIYTNPVGPATLDTAWSLQDFNVTAQAAGQAAVQFKWRLTSDGGLEYGGWNIDDVRVYKVDPAPAGFFAAYGTGCPGTGGLIPLLNGTGTPASGQNVSVAISNGKVGGSGIMFLTSATASIPTAGCTLLVGGTFYGGGIPLTLNGSGAVTLPATLPVGLAAFDLYMQFFGTDTGAANGMYSASNGLQMHIP